MCSQEVIFAGFGGQGILSMGKYLAYAGMEANLNVSWLPSYGPEMRGGTANCNVILTDAPIGSPIIIRATSLVVMNRPSLEKFEPLLEPGGLLIIDSDLIHRPVERTDVEVVRIPAQTVAERIGSKKAANMILLGALVQRTGMISLQELLQAVADHSKGEYFAVNKRAIEEGAQLVASLVRAGE